MSLENKDGDKIPKVDFSRAGEPAKELFPFGYNIGASITETILVYLQGLFMTNPYLDHKFEYNDHSKIKIIDQGAFSELEIDRDPVIVVERGGVQALGRGGLNNLLSVSTPTGDEERIDLFSCPVNIKVYADYAHAEQYASLIFFALNFLTEPLKKFTIYKVQPPVMSGIRVYEKDSKPSIFFTAVSVTLIKEGYVKISRKHHPVLRNFVFKGRQVFENGNRIIVRIS